MFGSLHSHPNGLSQQPGGWRAGVFFVAGLMGCACHVPGVLLHVLRSAACVKIGHTAHMLPSAYAADITEQLALLLPYVQAAFPGAVVIASTEEASCTAAHGSMQGLQCSVDDRAPREQQSSTKGT